VVDILCRLGHGDSLPDAAVSGHGDSRRIFNHLIQTQQRDSHVLIQHGVYRIFRHPSYVGFSTGPLRRSCSWEMCCMRWLLVSLRGNFFDGVSLMKRRVCAFNIPTTIPRMWRARGWGFHFCRATALVETITTPPVPKKTREIICVEQQRNK
jgi:hypothetical protein